MGKSAYIGASNKARKIKTIYIGVSGKARKIKKAWIGVGGKAREFYSGLEYLKLIYGYTKWDTSGASINNNVYSENHGVSFGTYEYETQEHKYIGKIDKWAKIRSNTLYRSIGRELPDIEWETVASITAPTQAPSSYSLSSCIIDKFCIVSAYSQTGNTAYVIDIETGEKGPEKVFASTGGDIFASVCTCDGAGTIVTFNSSDYNFYKYTINESTLELSTPTVIASRPSSSTYPRFRNAGAYWDGSKFVCIYTFDNSAGSSTYYPTACLFINGSKIRDIIPPGGYCNGLSGNPYIVVDDTYLYVIFMCSRPVSSTRQYTVEGYKLPLTNLNGTPTSFSFTSPESSKPINWVSSDGEYLYMLFYSNDDSKIYRSSRMSGTFTLLFSKADGYLNYSDPFGRPIICSTYNSRPFATYQPV